MKTRTITIDLITGTRPHSTPVIIYDEDGYPLVCTHGFQAELCIRRLPKKFRLRISNQRIRGGIESFFSWAHGGNAALFSTGRVLCGVSALKLISKIIPRSKLPPHTTRYHSIWFKLLKS